MSNNVTYFREEVWRRQFNDNLAGFLEYGCAEGEAVSLASREASRFVLEMDMRVAASTYGSTPIGPLSPEWDWNRQVEDSNV